MRIGLYFGSFNPIHNGHCIIANHMLAFTTLQQVWFVISPQNPFKPSAGLLNEYDRLHLVKLAIEGTEGLKASDIEFQLSRPSYTIDTLTYLSEKFPRHTFSIIMGSDGYQNIERWKNAAVLLDRYDIYVYERPGFPVTSPFPRTTMVKAPMLDISATHIREMIKSGKDIRFLVPDRVREDIERNGYYQ
ncbi:nicotinate (nicotinamide) nucleotide adenylyltransferase [Flavihumibacter petaseus]|uniref:Probable nicotinate-nucleotide adenylyltransferase n=1 Tax=Flavihumibacter petaseus NBRC 106054 TaxID=1220578 RepID=A0A0E9MXN4_9BACT|nr:nicotinate (nicotinamide) nucleotide adenylyltransferase [Flavihumibacter petaseus]GAO42273.1 putative nicotinate-nucleotide adenylyltransferase [Flavihumibacter petaseus NBRC 106054]